MKKRHRPPSRIRYDKTHPTVSIRVSQEMYGQLKELRSKSGKSLGDILREALGKQAPSVKQAFTNGFMAAQEKFRVTYTCSKCGKPIEVTSPKEKRAIASYMESNFWVHVECLKNHM
jgi:Ribbon-helix-helix protein, copG family